MNENRESVDRPLSAESKRAYVPPAISWEEELKVRGGISAACAKIAGTGEPCNSFPATS